MTDKRTILSHHSETVHHQRQPGEQRREQPRSVQETEVAPGLFLQRVHERREIYSWEDGLGSTLVFDVTGIRRKVQAIAEPDWDSNGVSLISSPITPELVEFLIEKRGVEPWRIDELQPHELVEPAIGFAAKHESGEIALITIDGNHRIARRARDGCPYAQVYLFDVPKFATFIAPPGDESRFFREA